MPIKTTWDDLATLGWPKSKIFATLNEKRNGTMENEVNLHINDAFNEQYSWLGFNSLSGAAQMVRTQSSTIIQSDVIATLDNSQNDSTTTESFTYTVTLNSTRSLTTTVPSAIKLDQFVSVLVGSAMLKVSTDTETTDTDSILLIKTFKFQITAGPYEKIELVKNTNQVTQADTYNAPYGFKGFIGTNGKRWNGHEHWGFSIDTNLNKPTGNLEVVSVFNHFPQLSFKMNRVGGQGTITSKALFLSPAGAAHNVELEIKDANNPDDKSGDPAGTVHGF